jgi:alcohol dehydrogenase class IV
MFRYHVQSDMIAGNGEFRKIATILKEKGFRQPSFLVDEGFARGDLWRETENRLRSEFGSALTLHINSGSAEPTYDTLRATLKKFREATQDVIVGVGGGSCMDTAKAVAGLVTNLGDPIEYRGFDKLKVPGVPVVLVPTTAGTGSEASFNASFVDTASNRKMGVNGRHMFAVLAILDGETTLTCPYNAALSAGIDALVHTLEGFVCNQRNPMSNMLARQAFTLLVNALPSLKNDPQNVDKRLDLLLGAYLGGVVQMNSGSGVAAAISYPLSVYYKVPHGIGGGIFCVDMVKFNIDAGFYLYAELAPLIGVEKAGATEKENAMAVLKYLQDLWRTLNVPAILAGFGIGPDKYEHIMKIMQTQQPGFDQNPVLFTVVDHLPNFIKPFLAIDVGSAGR